MQNESGAGLSLGFPSSGQCFASVRHRHQIPKWYLVFQFGVWFAGGFSQCLLHPWHLVFPLHWTLQRGCLLTLGPFFSNMSLSLVTQFVSLAVGRGSSLLLVSLGLRQALPGGCGLLCPPSPAGVCPEVFQGLSQGLDDQFLSVCQGPSQCQHWKFNICPRETGTRDGRIIFCSLV